MATRKPQGQNIGNSGEFYVAYLLSALDYVVTITLGRNEGYDLIAVAPSEETYKISVKTMYARNQKKFPLNKKDESPKGKDIYAFVKLNEFQEQPDYWILPAEVVSAVVAKSHQLYLEDVDRKGRQHKDNSIRNFLLTDHKYYPSGWSAIVQRYYKNQDLPNLPGRKEISV